TVDTACLMSEVSLGHIDTCGTHRVCLHATLSGGHLGGFTHDTPAWQTPFRHPTIGSATVVLTVSLKDATPACHSDWGALRWLHTRHPSLAHIIHTLMTPTGLGYCSQSPQASHSQAYSSEAPTEYAVLLPSTV